MRNLVLAAVVLGSACGTAGFVGSSDTTPYRPLCDPSPTSCGGSSDSSGTNAIVIGVVGLTLLAGAAAMQIISG